MSSTTITQVALDFLRHARAGHRAAAERLTTPAARHHNPLFPTGMGALLDAIVAAAQANPTRTSTVQRTVTEGHLVVVHSRVDHGPGAGSAAVMHCFRFEGDHIAELWDVGQPVPAESPNADGMF